MKIQLQSDFYDYYDHAFCSKYEIPDYVFKRPSVYPEIPRERMFELFTESGMQTPAHGRNKDIFDCLDVVEHLDETAHRGEGKQLVSLAASGKTTFKVEKILRNNAQCAKSDRVLFVGEHLFSLRYICLNDWRSNGPGCKIEVLDVKENGRRNWPLAIKLCEFPLLAFDSITNRFDDEIFYIDINISPSWKGIFLEKLLHPSTVIDFIEEYVRKINKEVENDKRTG